MDRVLIQAQALVTCSPGSTVLSPGATIIENGLITDVGALDSLANQGQFSKVVGDPTRHVVIPGLVNAHHHTFRPGRVRRLSYPLELMLVQTKRRRLSSLTEDEIYDHTLWGASCMLRGGITSVLDVYPLESGVGDFGLGAGMDAYLASGMRATVCAMCSDQSNFTYEDDQSFIKRLPATLAADVSGQLQKFDARRFFSVWNDISAEYDGRDGRLRVGFGPLGPQWCTDPLLSELKRVATGRGAPVQTHLLESPFQAVEAVRRYGTTAVRHLHDIGFLDERTSCAHAVWLTAKDLKILAESGATVVTNPGSNLRTADGIAPVRQMVDAGCNVAMGLDAFGFEPEFDLFREMRLALLLQRRPGWDRKHVSARDVLGMATVGGGMTLTAPVPVGQIAPGFAGDVVLLDREKLLSWPYVDPEEPVEELVLGAGSKDAVDHVLVGGRCVVEDGALVDMDVNELAQRVRASVERFLPELFDSDRMFRTLAPYIDSYFSGVDLQAVGIDAYSTLVDEHRLLAETEKQQQTDA